MGELVGEDVGEEEDPLGGGGGGGSLGGGDPADAGVAGIETEPPFGPSMSPTFPVFGAGWSNRPIESVLQVPVEESQVQLVSLLQLD